jgi:hypothetical protein
MTGWPGTAIRVPEALAVLGVGYHFQPARTVDKARETALRKLRTYNFFFVAHNIYFCVTWKLQVMRNLLIYSMEQSHFEKLTCFPLVNKFSAFYGTRRLISAFIRACHLSLS